MGDVGEKLKNLCDQEKICQSFINVPKIPGLDIEFMKFEISAIICKSHETQLLFEDGCGIFILQWCGLWDQIYIPISYKSDLKLLL